MSARYGRGTITAYRTNAGRRYRWQLLVREIPGDETSKLVRIGKGAYERRVDAQKALDLARSQDQKGRLAIGKKGTFASYAKSWLTALDLSNSTIKGYEKNLRVHILPVFGEKRLDQISAAQISRFYKDLAERGRKDRLEGAPLSANTINKIHITMSQIFSFCVEEGLLGTNPCQNRKLLGVSSGRSIRATSDEVETFSLSDLNRVMTWLNLDAQHHLFPLWFFIAHTGVRRGEAIAVKWKDLNLTDRKISIRRAADSARARATKVTKTGRERLVELTDSAVQMLIAWREQRAVLGPEFVQPDSFIFGTLDNQLRTPNDVSAQWARIMKKAQSTFGGLPWVTLKGLRHTHATLLLQSGEASKVVQERLGHSDIGTTLNIYSHVTPTIQREAIDRFDEWIQQNSPPTSS
jgi:integrase